MFFSDSDELRAITKPFKGHLWPIPHPHHPPIPPSHPRRVRLRRGVVRRLGDDAGGSLPPRGPRPHRGGRGGGRASAAGVTGMGMPLNGGEKKGGNVLGNGC